MEISWDMYYNISKKNLRKNDNVRRNICEERISFFFHRLNSSLVEILDNDRINFNSIAFEILKKKSM